MELLVVREGSIAASSSNTTLFDAAEVVAVLETFFSFENVDVNFRIRHDSSEEALPILFHVLQIWHVDPCPMIRALCKRSADIKSTTDSTICRAIISSHAFGCWWSSGRASGPEILKTIYLSTLQLETIFIFNPNNLQTYTFLSGW